MVLLLIVKEHDGAHSRLLPSGPLGEMWVGAWDMLTCAPGTSVLRMRASDGSWPWLTPALCLGLVKSSLYLGLSCSTSKS